MQMAKGIGKKVQGAADFLSGTSRIDNTTDPTSARGMMNRKAASLRAPSMAQAKMYQRKGN